MEGGIHFVKLMVRNCKKFFVLSNNGAEFYSFRTHNFTNFGILNMNMSVAIDGKTNYVQSRSNKLVVYDVALLEFLLKNKTYRPIIEATKSIKGQQLFVPFIFDIIQGKKLSLLKVYPKDAVWEEDEDYSGKSVLVFRPATAAHLEFQQHWVEVNRIFTGEMLRMQETVLNGKVANEFVMLEKDKITKMSTAIKDKYNEYEKGRDYLTSALSMVFFMQTDTAPAVGIVLQESFPINPTYRSKKRSRETEEEKEPLEKDVSH